MRQTEMKSLRALALVLFQLLLTASATSLARADLYSIGDPTPQEQFNLELINRSRANPPAEGVRLRDTSDPDVKASYAYFQVDTSLMATEFAAIAPAPPLSMNGSLMAAARAHSQDMLSNQFQGHNGSDGSTVGDRIATPGKYWLAFAENVYAYSRSVFYGHAGFEVDWGTGLGGMQTPPGHRLNLHNSAYREIGIGIIQGSNGNFGPQVVTQDLATDLSPAPFITGAAYVDSNQNEFYDIGEGLGGITVTVSGSNFSAVTASAGGYSVPVPGDGTYTVNFSGPGFLPQQKTVTVVGQTNVKVDYLAQAGSAPTPAVIHISSISTQPGQPVKLIFEVVSGQAITFRLEETANIGAGWTQETAVTFQSLGGNRWQATAPARAAKMFYRISAT